MLRSTQVEASSESLQQLYRELPIKFYTTMLQCPEKIWPQYDWKNVSILMLEKGRPAVVWKGDSNQVNFVEEKFVPTEAYLGLYKFFDWEATTGISLHPSPGSFFLEDQRLFGLAVHEGFHKVGQNGWIKPQTARGTVIPFEAEPRLYRRMMYRNLRAYFLDPQKNREALRKAAYWNHRWKSKYPEEFTSSTDAIEGTAEYVEELAKIYADTGCGVSEEVVLEALQQRVQTEASYATQTVQFQLDTEGYSFGSLAGFILTYLVEDAHWFFAAQQGETPVDVLLNTQKPLYEKIDKALKKEYMVAAEKENQNVEIMLGTFLTDILDKKFIRLGLVGKSASYSPKGFFMPKKQPHITVIPLGSDLQLNNQSQSVTVSAETVLFQTTESPCENSFFKALIPASDLRIDNGSIALTSNGLKGKMKGSLKTDAEGFQWFCGDKS